MFENITETFNQDPNVKEDTEAVLRYFLVHELKLDGNIDFQNVHRLKRNNDRSKTRGIVARFVHFRDKESVIKAAQENLRGKSQKVYSQYPPEISNRRKELVPIMKEFRDQGKRASIVVDKLYVDGQRFVPGQQTAGAETEICQEISMSDSGRTGGIERETLI